MASDDFGGFQSNDWGTDWWMWIDRLSWIISQASIRIGAAVISGAFAIAASNMAERQGSLANLMLAAAGVFAAWFVVSSVSAVGKRR